MNLEEVKQALAWLDGHPLVAGNDQLLAVVGAARRYVEMMEGTEDELVPVSEEEK